MKRYRHSSSSVTRAGSLFFAVRGLVRTRFAQGRKLNPSEWLRVETMKFINDRKRPSMRDIADHLSITAPSATSLVGGLVKDGLAQKAQNPRDRRAFEVVLTPVGKRLLTRTMKRGAGILADVFSTLSPRELSAFTAALARLSEGAGE